MPCRSCRPLDMQRLAFPGELWFVLVNPVFQAPTAEMRAMLPAEVPMASAVHNCAMSGTLVRPPGPPTLGTPTPCWARPLVRQVGSPLLVQILAVCQGQACCRDACAVFGQTRAALQGVTRGGRVLC